MQESLPYPFHFFISVVKKEHSSRQSRIASSRSTASIDVHQIARCFFPCALSNTTPSNISIRETFLRQMYRQATCDKIPYPLLSYIPWFNSQQCLHIKGSFFSKAWVHKMTVALICTCGNAWNAVGQYRAELLAISVYPSITCAATSEGKRRSS